MIKWTAETLDKENQETVVRLKKVFADKIIGTQLYRDQLVVDVNSEHLTEIITFLKNQPSEFDLLIDLSGADYQNYPQKMPTRFAVAYVFYSTARNIYIKLRGFASGDDNSPKLPSIASLFKGAVDQEREAYDLLGIIFEGHPNLSRIMLPDDYQGHPLRKDYPLRGYGERSSFPVIEPLGSMVHHIPSTK